MNNLHSAGNDNNKYFYEPICESITDQIKQSSGPPVETTEKVEKVKSENINAPISQMPIQTSEDTKKVQHTLNKKISRKFTMNGVLLPPTKCVSPEESSRLTSGSTPMPPTSSEDTEKLEQISPRKSNRYRTWTMNGASPLPMLPTKYVPSEDSSRSRSGSTPMPSTSSQGSVDPKAVVDDLIAQNNAIQRSARFRYPEQEKVLMEILLTEQNFLNDITKLKEVIVKLQEIGALQENDYPEVKECLSTIKQKTLAACMVHFEQATSAIEKVQVFSQAFTSLLFKIVFGGVGHLAPIQELADFLDAADLSIFKDLNNIKLAYDSFCKQTPMRDKQQNDTVLSKAVRLTYTRLYPNYRKTKTMGEDNYGRLYQRFPRYPLLIEELIKPLRQEIKTLESSNIPLP